MANKKQAIFIVGFSNWGKTTIINALFGRARFNPNTEYFVNDVAFNIPFHVMPQSNDDINEIAWLAEITSRTGSGQNLIAALCPNLHYGNNFIRILSSELFQERYDKLHLFLIENKYEHHAKLIIGDIKRVAKRIPKINTIVINASIYIQDYEVLTTPYNETLDIIYNQLIFNLRHEEQLEQIREELNTIFNII